MRKKAFTVIELIVTLVVLAVLVSLALVSYKAYVERAQYGEALVNIGAIKNGEESSKLQTGVYPSADNAEEINELLGVGITPRYYEYRVIGGIDDYLVIAKRIGEDLNDYLGAGIIPSETSVVAMDRSGAVSNAALFATVGGQGTGGGTTGTGGWGPLGGVTTWGGVPGGGGGGTGGTGGGGGGVVGGLNTPPWTGGGSITGGGLPGIVYGATLDQINSAMGALSGLGFSYTSASGIKLDGDTVQDYLDLIKAKNIAISWVDLPYTETITSTTWSLSGTWGQWDNDTNTIQLNSAMQTLPGFPPEAIAAIAIHEATHADYHYYPAVWENRIETLWPDVATVVNATIAKGDPDPLRTPVWDPVGKKWVTGPYLVKSQTEEYFTHMDQAEFWGEAGTAYSGVQGAGILMEDDNYTHAQQGEDSMRAYISSNHDYASLPEFYYEGFEPS